MLNTSTATSLVVALMLLLAWFLGNIVPFFGAAVDLLGASVTPWGKPNFWGETPHGGSFRDVGKFV